MRSSVGLTLCIKASTRSSSQRINKATGTGTVKNYCTTTFHRDSNRQKIRLQGDCAHAKHGTLRSRSSNQLSDSRLFNHKVSQGTVTRWCYSCVLVWQGRLEWEDRPNIQILFPPLRGRQYSDASAANPLSIRKERNYTHRHKNTRCWYGCQSVSTSFFALPPKFTCYSCHPTAPFRNICTHKQPWGAICRACSRAGGQGLHGPQTRGGIRAGGRRPAQTQTQPITASTGYHNPFIFMGNICELNPKEHDMWPEHMSTSPMGPTEGILLFMDTPFALCN